MALKSRFAQGCVGVLLRRNGFWLHERQTARWLVLLRRCMYTSSAVFARVTVNRVPVGLIQYDPLHRRFLLAPCNLRLSLDQSWLCFFFHLFQE